MSKIYLRGLRDPILVSRKQAEAVKAMYEDIKFPPEHAISFEEASFAKREIKTIILDRDDKSDDEKYKDSRESFEEYIQGKNERLDMSPRVRAENSIGYFNFIWWGFHGDKEIPDEVWEQAKDAMEKYYSENPRMIWAMPRIFKSIIGGNEMDGTAEKILSSLHFS